MDEQATSSLARAETWLCITTLFYFLMNGAQLFETLVIVPKWTAGPPESLHYFKGRYGMDLKTFWIVLHSLHEVTFMLAIVFCWSTAIRYPLLVLFAIHFAARVWTILYFAPNIIAFQKVANTGNHTPALARKAVLWRRLNYIRVGAFLAISAGLLPLCIKLLNLKIAWL